MKLDIIFVTCNHENIIKDCYDKVKKELKESKHKIYFVDNCSTDDTLEELQKIYEKDEDRVRIIKLSKHTNYNSCVISALNYCNNDYAIVYDLDLDCDISLKKLATFLKENEQYDSVCLCKKIKKDNFFKKNYKKLVNKFNFYEHIDGLSNFRIFNKKMYSSLITHSIDNEIDNYTFDNVGFNIYYDNVNSEHEYEEKVFLPQCLKPVITSICIGSLCLTGFIALLISCIFIKFNLCVFTLLLLLLLSGFIFIIMGVIGRNMLKHIYKREPNFIIKERIGFDEKVL
jgi:glycosyltransferase involved in cell wall biosynthesis